MTVVHMLALLDVPYAATVLPLRGIRLIYMVERLRLMVEAFVRSLSAVWTALVLMAASFLAFGIIGMNLYSGLLWHCVEALDRDRKECEAAGLTWGNRPFHFGVVSVWHELEQPAEMARTKLCPDPFHAGPRERRI